MCAIEIKITDKSVSIKPTVGPWDFQSYGNSHYRKTCNCNVSHPHLQRWWALPYEMFPMALHYMIFALEVWTTKVTIMCTEFEVWVTWIIKIPKHHINPAHMTTPQSACLRNDSSYRDLHGTQRWRTAAAGGARVGDNQWLSQCLSLACWSAVSAVKRIVDNEKLLQSMYKHQEAQKSSCMQIHTQYPTNTKQPQK